MKWFKIIKEWAKKHITLPKFHIPFKLNDQKLELYMRVTCLIAGFLMVFYALYGVDPRLAFGLGGFALMKFSGLVMRG